MSSLFLSILLPLLFNPPNPPNPSNYIEILVTVTGRTTRRGSGNYVLSSRAAGKAPAVPQKRVSKASSGGKRKRLKTTIDVIRLESLSLLPITNPNLTPPTKAILEVTLNKLAIL